jgi:hypothetical protein
MTGNRYVAFSILKSGQVKSCSCLKAKNEYGVCQCMYTGFLIYFAAVERYMTFISQCQGDY